MASKARCCAKSFKSGQNTILAVFSVFGQADATMIIGTRSYLSIGLS